VTVTSLDQVSGDRCRFKDLCIDAADPLVLATFWATALGLSTEVLDTGARRLVDDTAEHTVWVNEVPEPRTVKQRVHLDVRVGRVAELQPAGATVVRELPRWTLLTDPEGGELCAFVRPTSELGTYRLLEVVVDAVDPGAIAAWWADRFGTTAQESEDGSFWWLPAGGSRPVDWCFQAVPEPKLVKNRIHWDVVGDPAGLVAAGATVLRGRDDDVAWDLLADPEGNEFCVFPPR
jgi:glyoxalase superfamily protein